MACQKPPEVNAGFLSDLSRQFHTKLERAQLDPLDGGLTAADEGGQFFLTEAEDAAQRGQNVLVLGAGRHGAT